MRTRPSAVRRDIFVETDQLENNPKLRQERHIISSSFEDIPLVILLAIPDDATPAGA
jgi:hypothetical protein